ncbi:MarR family transcriptional regulator [Bradyrhizobium sp. LTSPM299]|uniref:MarR family winged helix-turn-helix transcriptional regulator n=1 Tax=Bradyrhizobium sp. LTSPM299 TaxID=1619233 RepID=UPI0005C9DA99|nr:MarR family transcriptional regulator [Bradyrhizobium sp. LTSPM299]KJC59241.1 MarR family transcriptional regulator [Bradyrhizobium sp. LTSPM299]
MTSHVPLDGQLCFSLYATSMAINRAYKPMLDAMGITYPQYLVLSVLAENGEQTISTIAERLDLEPSTITPLVKRLEHAGLLSRRRNPRDEREVQVALTASGKRLHDESGCLTETLLRRSGLTVPEMISLNERIQSLRHALVADDGGQSSDPGSVDS